LHDEDEIEESLWELWDATAPAEINSEGHPQVLLMPTLTTIPSHDRKHLDQ
jgi:hypothetical protein